MATACHVWGIYWTPIDQLKRGFTCLALGFLLVYVFWGKYYYPSGVCTHTYHTYILYLLLNFFLINYACMFTLRHRHTRTGIELQTSGAAGGKLKLCDSSLAVYIYF